MWAIYYGDGMVWWGETRADWQRAPDDGVQVVRRDGPTDYRGWAHVSDRDLWTGQDEYDPFGWGAKTGSLIPDDEYWRIWYEAAYDGNPPFDQRPEAVR